MPGGTGVAVFYLHRNASSAKCWLEELPFNNGGWRVIYGQENLSYDSQGTMTIKMSGPAGARLETQDMRLHGAYTVDVKASSAPGVVTAFYVSPVGWHLPQAAGQSHGERLVGLREYSRLLHWSPQKRTDTELVTYTINWQPDSVSWYMGGRLLRVVRNGEWVRWSDGTNTQNFARVFQAPDRASHVAISMWTDLRKDPKLVFGGVFDASKGPYYSSFRNFRRVVCDEVQGAPQAAPDPGWLYARKKS
eukprot:gene11732-11876_t